MGKIQIISNELLKSTTEKAKNSPRLRINHNFHEDLADPINRMLNALEPDTYCQPHKHEDPDKNEIFLVLKGKMAVFIFDDNGNITQTVILSPNDGCYGIEIAPRIWHTIVSLEPESVAYEVKDGPYVPAIDKNFASWAPKEGDIECKEYLEVLKSKLVM